MSKIKIVNIYPHKHLYTDSTLQVLIRSASARYFFLMSTHKVCFLGQIPKIFYMATSLIWSNRMLALSGPVTSNYWYGKYPKNSNTKASDKMTYANSVDPDQTAPEGAVWSGSTLFAIPLNI